MSPKAASPSLSEQYTDLLAKVMVATPDIEHDLRDANSLSLLYRDFARLHRDAGGPAEADALDARRRALWQRGIGRTRTILSCCASLSDAAARTTSSP